MEFKKEIIQEMESIHARLLEAIKTQDHVIFENFLKSQAKDARTLTLTLLVFRHAVKAVLEDQRLLRLIGVPNVPIEKVNNYCTVLAIISGLLLEFFEREVDKGNFSFLVEKEEG